MKRYLGLIALLVVVGAGTAEAQRMDAAGAPRPEGWKDPNTATWWGLVAPGAGHLYAGETGRGLALLGVGAALGAATWVLWDQDLEGECVPNQGCNLTQSLAYWIPGGALIGVWAFSVFDAHRSAMRMNQRRGFSMLEGVQPHVVQVGARTELGVRVVRPRATH
jgi:hypothetical protein